MTTYVPDYTITSPILDTLEPFAFPLVIWALFCLTVYGIKKLIYKWRNR